MGELLERVGTADPERDSRLEKEREERVEADRRGAIRRNLAELLRDRGGRYAECRLENFDTPTLKHESAVKRLRAYAESLTEHVAAGDNLTLFGPVGTGKDHLLAAMMGLAIIAGFRTAWRSGADLFGELRDRIDEQRSESRWVSELATVDVLAISDPLPPFGALSEFQAAMLFRVIDARYSRGRSTWITINCKDGKEAESRLTPQIVDRLRHNAMSVQCDWPSYRKPLS